MKSIYTIYEKLCEEPKEDSSRYRVMSLPKLQYHKIGISQTGTPMFFVKCRNEDNVRTIDYNLEYISVQFNQECELRHDDQVTYTVDNYTVISLKTDLENLQEYFINIIYSVLYNIDTIPSIGKLKHEIEQLIELFGRLTKPAIKTIQGLWAELLVIEQSADPEYLISAWHKSPFDKYDFNDGKDKIEVKSTTKNQRIHSFSLSQLNPGKGAELIIASIMTEEIGVGKNVMDLIKIIERRVNKEIVLNYLNTIVFQVIGSDIKKTFSIYFDYQEAVDSLSYYDFKNIPKISSETLPNELSNVKFDCNLTCIEKQKSFSGTSILFKALIGEQ